MLVADMPRDRIFAGQGHVTMSITKVSGRTKWKEHDEISKVANFEAPAA